jgi:hypothetical protein
MIAAMGRILLALGVVCAACTADARKPEAEPAPPEQPEPPKEKADPPPVEAGWARIEYLDVDIKVPPDTTVDGNLIKTTRPACEIALRPLPERPTAWAGFFSSLGGKPQIRKVRAGTLELECRIFGEAPPSACAALCDGLRAVPGGTADEPYPPGPPVIAYSSAGGFADLDRGGYFVWPDGTVQFMGSSCPRYRGKRAKVAPAALDKVLKELEEGGFFAFEENLRARMSECCDCGETVIEVRRGNRVVQGMQVCSDAAKEASLAFQKAGELVGSNPCQ